MSDIIGLLEAYSDNTGIMIVLGAIGVAMAALITMKAIQRFFKVKVDSHNRKVIRTCPHFEMTPHETSRGFGFAISRLTVTVGMGMNQCTRCGQQSTWAETDAAEAFYSQNPAALAERLGYENKVVKHMKNQKWTVNRD